MNMKSIITIDGPSGSGKGTIAARVAEKLGWRILDSGALYRLVGHSVSQATVPLEDIERISNIAGKLDVEFRADRVLLAGEDVSLAIRSETAGNMASKVAAIPEVRAALLEWQKDYASPAGLVADGRDMGTVVFPDAPIKIFLTASAEERAMRRYKQLIEKGIGANLISLTAEIEERDARDRDRSVAPLKPAVGAIEIDSTVLGIDEVVVRVIAAVKKVWPNLAV
jgi:cytidylate kinase